MRSYKEPLVRILHAYPPGNPGLVTALEAICHTAEENGAKDAKSALAADVCEGLHPFHPPKGLKCLRCYHAEHNYAMEEQVAAEIETVREEKKQP